MKNIVTFLVFMILGWKVSVSLASNPDVETTVKALKFIRMVHKVYDAKVEGYSNYHDHFAGGVNPWSNRTRPGYIIIEGYYGTLVSTVHTPLGYISTCGGSGGTPDSTDEINQAVKDLPGIKLNLNP
ncbi:hypothetical protein [Endozoicomonas sp. Mp262]|uniref:hypothetical protein n=1 Tax=Endozoicomonas sp. Mp262 TaxID=2919499 RepID=UPI0021DB3173